MASKHTSSCTSLVQSDRSASVSEATLYATSTKKRLKTFEKLPTPHYVGPSSLAKHGFIYLKTDNSVECTNCRKVVRQWKTGDHPKDQQFHKQGCKFVEATTPMDLSVGAAGTSEPERMDDMPLETASSSTKKTLPIDGAPKSLAPENRKVFIKGAQPASMPPLHTEERRPNPPASSSTSEASEEMLLARLTPIHMLSSTQSDENVCSNSLPSFGMEPNRDRIRRVEEQAHGRLRQDPNQPSSSREEPPPRRNQSSTEISDEEAKNLDMKFAKNRLNTFERFWSIRNIFKNIRLLVICGFFCLGYGDAVQCFYCGIILANWSRNDDPRRRHLECSSDCRFAREGNCGNTPLPPEVRRRTYQSRSSRQSTNARRECSPPSDRRLSPQQALPATSETSHPESVLPEAYANLTPAQRERNNLMIEFPCGNAMNEAMRDERARLQSFQNSAFRQHTQLRASNETLAQAGLYYDGVADRTKCWYCGGGLKDYMQNDDPWVEHAKFYPDCEYLLQQRGPAWVTSISIQHPYIQRPVLPQSVGNALPAGSYSAARGGVFSNSLVANEEVILHHAMQTHPVQHARNMGFSDQLIRDAQLRRILRLGSCYETAEALTEALLHPDTDPATLAAGLPQQSNISHSSQPQRRTITILGGNFVGANIIDGRLQPRSTTRNTLTINGLPIEEYIANQDDAMGVETEYSPVHVFNNIGGTVSPSGISGSNQIASTNPPAATNPSYGNSVASASSTESTGSAEERLEALQRDLQCKICYSAPAQILFQPCGHICACFDCARRLTSCPVCRQPIVRYLRTYRS